MATLSNPFELLSLDDGGELHPLITEIGEAKSQKNKNKNKNKNKRPEEELQTYVNYTFENMGTNVLPILLQ